MIKQLGTFLARIAGLRRKEEYAAAIVETERAWDELLDVPRRLVDVVDTPTLAELLREPARMRVAAQLLVEEARVRAATGDPAHAATCHRRALELYLEAHALEPSEDDDVAILELSRNVPASQLDARYRS